MSLYSPATFAAFPTQIIENEDVQLEQFEMGYFIDKSQTMSFESIKQQEFKLTPNALSLGTEAKTTWSKIALHNTTKSALKIYLHHPYAYHNRAVELYEVVDDQLLNHRVLNMDDKDTQQWMYRGSAVFEITLSPDKQTTLFVKGVAFSHQWFALNLYSEENSKRALLGQYTNIALAVGMILALIIYNFLLFFSSRLREHFYYACYLVAGGFWIALSYGLLADLFNVYGSITLKWHLSLVAMPIFLLLFMINIFETQKKYPIEHWALLSILTLLIVDFIYGLFDIVTALQYSSTLAAIMMAVSLCVTFSMLIRKQPIAPFFLLGHGLFVFFSALAVFFYKGKAEFSYINSHGVGIGILLEALVLSLIVAYRIRILENLKATQADLQVLASTDPLTQLFNRRHFSHAANQLLKQARIAQQPSSVAIIDIDLFKKINDTYGHASGDESIKHAANMIKGLSRHQDLVARYGGEEFIILMPNTVANDAYKLTERIRIALESATLANNKNHLNFTISAGVAEIDSQTFNLKEAMDSADKALYKAKNNGRNQSQLAGE
ncbi:diguanylate cyclase [Cognaticolwellia aestuarii]|uniref:sensor domain-containing diguanylate cyclase n=1 Tax=Cognaticolwellia aestuarii TaxID=329993 RepID=UPI0011784B0F|nr:diguanylate cyclase [Cognaticolwellia aestuarii]